MPDTTSNGTYPDLGVFQDILMHVKLRVEHNDLQIPGVPDIIVRMNEVNTIARLCDYINKNTDIDWYYGYKTTEWDLGKVETDDDTTNSERRWTGSFMSLRGVNMHANIWEILYSETGYSPTHAGDAPTMTWVLLPESKLELREGVRVPPGWTEYLTRRETIWDAARAALPA